MVLYGTGITRGMVRIFDYNDEPAVVLSLVVSFGIGAVIGDLIGKHRKYLGPGYYVP